MTAGLAQTRNANYVADRYEPDLKIFRRILSVIGATSSEMLETPQGGDDESSRLRMRVMSATAGLDVETLRVLAVVSDGLLARASALPPTAGEEAKKAGKIEKPSSARERTPM